MLGGVGRPAIQVVVVYDRSSVRFYPEVQRDAHVVGLNLQSAKLRGQSIGALGFCIGALGFRIGPTDFDLCPIGLGV